MRTNEEFKQLVNDKYKKLKAEKKRRTNRIVTLGSSLLLCLIVSTVFIGNGMFKNVFSEEGLDSPTEDFEPSSAVSSWYGDAVQSAEESLYSEEAEINSSVHEDFESADQNASYVPDKLPQPTVSGTSDEIFEEEPLFPELDFEESCNEDTDMNSSFNSSFIQEEISENDSSPEESTPNDEHTTLRFSFLVITREAK